MKLIDFEGLNCYQNALVTVAASMGVDYKLAFSNLWPETDFDYDDDHKVYVTRRMSQNLESLGIRPEILVLASPPEALEALSALSDGEPFLACMDTFHIPWSPGFGAVHDAHYFAARKESPGLLSCFDPTYNAKCAISNDIASFFSKIYRIKRSAEKPLFSAICREEVTRLLPQMRSRMLDELDGCVNDRRKNALSLAKYADALINNRYLYKYYLDNASTPQQNYRDLFSMDFFSRWNAVKNGLYKAFVVRNNEGIISEVSELFGGLIDEEISAANAQFISQF